MYGVDIHVDQGDLCRKMLAMRIWLDDHRFEPSTFSCRDTAYGMLVSIQFKIPAKRRPSRSVSTVRRTADWGLILKKN